MNNNNSKDLIKKFKDLRAGQFFYYKNVPYIKMDTSEVKIDEPINAVMCGNVSIFEDDWDVVLINRVIISNPPEEDLANGN